MNCKGIFVYVTLKVELSFSFEIYTFIYSDLDSILAYIGAFSVVIYSYFLSAGSTDKRLSRLHESKEAFSVLRDSKAISCG